MKLKLVFTSRLVADLFKNAIVLQKEGDRIHMALALGKERTPDYRNRYLGFIYDDIAEISARRGYQLVKKRKFDKNRYSSYKHELTIGKNSSTNAIDNCREFIFSKTDKSFDEIIKSYPVDSDSYRGQHYNNILREEEIKTDTDSSDYDVESDEEKVKLSRKCERLKRKIKREKKEK